MKRSLILALLLVFTGCAGKQKRADLFSIDATTSEGAALVSWFDGDEQAALDQAAKSGDAATAVWVRSEIAYYQGDVEGAYEQWLTMLRSHPGHALTRFAVARLYAARDEVVDFEHRIQPVFADLDYSKLAPLTRAYLSMLHQTVEYRLWASSDADKPFDASGFGFPARWLKTPNISPWRLSDFDREFAPERDAQLADRYLSPYTAVDTPTNREQLDPYWTSGITLYPSLGGSGVYYMESVATLEGSEARDYLVYGNFVAATKVWVDGELVFDRREDNYQTGKRFRRVRLQPGTHRILVKMAYQSGYRDWFDLTFIPEGNVPTNESGLSFTYACMGDRELPGCHSGAIVEAGAKLLDDTKLPSELEQIFVKSDEVERASDIALWLTMVAAYFGGEHPAFEPAWQELSKRRPEFAAGWFLWAEEVQTLWQVPAKLRDSRALVAIRKAHELDPDSVRNQATLGQWLTTKGEEREARAMLATARDNAYDGDRLLTYEPLSAWAAYLDSKNWDVAAEKAWRVVLEADPANCRAAGKLQGILYGRSDYVPPEKITPRAADCPDLAENWDLLDETDTESRLKYAMQSAGRNPLRGDFARNVALELYRAGQEKQALDYLRAATKVSPDSATLASELADRAYARGEEDRARAILTEFEKHEGTSAWLLWKRATMDGKLPLADLMPDGRATALKAVADGQKKALSNDEAYFVMDFAARRYFPDGSKITLTHTVVRVMTKGAIDRYAEQNLPGNARPLLVRTIKQDGTVREPEQTAGKSTLSMPGLAEGDFVEVAYLQYDGPEFPDSEIEGVRFFFKMKDISTLHSEYVVIGDVAEFIRENDAPAAEKFEYKGMPAVRFLAKNNPRPRSEPGAPAVEEWLPWVQMYRNGETIDDVERTRRDIRESILDSSKRAEAFDDAVAEWTSGELGEVGSMAWVKSVFYAVSPLVSEPSISARSFNTDVNHVILLKEGNTMLVLQAVFDHFDVPADVFLIKSKYQIPTVYPLREGSNYGSVLLRVKTSDEGDVWLSPAGPDAMFGAVSAALTGQPAVCATCAESEKLNIPGDLKTPKQSIEATAKLNASGVLSGRVTVTWDGGSAASLRSGLRSRTDQISRQKLIDAVIAGVFTGASATAYDIQNELDPDAPLRIIIDFTRDGFAREVSPGVFQVETQLFVDALASAFGGLSERTTPLMVRFHMDNSYRLDLELEGWAGAELATQSGERRFDSRFGNARRTTTLQGNKLVIDASTNVPVQRVSAADYKEFTQWGLAVEQSSVLLVKLKK